MKKNAVKNKIKAPLITGPRMKVRKSIFFATVYSVTDDKQARKIVKQMKREDRKATHIAFAFRIDVNPVVEGMSDDGEPRGTGGFPILMLLRNKELKDRLVTVTRYWGGVKLGPGNLKRAYIKAAREALGGLTNIISKPRVNIL